MGDVVEMKKRETKISDALEEIIKYVKILEQKNSDLKAENDLLKAGNPYTKSLDSLPDVLVAQDIANYLHISRYRAYEYLKISPQYGGILSFETGRSIRCMKADFVEWLNNQKNQKAHGIRKNAREG